MIYEGPHLLGGVNVCLRNTIPRRYENDGMMFICGRLFCLKNARIRSPGVGVGLLLGYKLYMELYMVKFGTEFHIP